MLVEATELLVAFSEASAVTLAGAIELLAAFSEVCTVILSDPNGLLVTC